MVLFIVEPDSRQSRDNTLSLPHIFADTDNEQYNALLNFLGLLTGCAMVTVITFYVWKFCLFEKYGAYLPIDKNIDA